MKNQYVLAMYDIRGKQNYIFGGKRLKEIIGGSGIVRDCFRDYLYPAARQYRQQLGIEDEGEAIYQPEKEERFSVSLFEERMKEERYLGEVVYEGGGNLFVIYKNKETCIGINRIFTRTLLAETYSLKVLCSYKEGVNFDDYKRDKKELGEIHRKYEAKHSVDIPMHVLPFTQVDTRTSLPIYRKNPVAGEVTKESFTKLEKYQEIVNQDTQQGEVQFDLLITEKGEDSHLAIVYIDGNHMGANVEACLQAAGGNGYEACVTALRRFSADIQKNYITDRIEDINRCLKKKYNQTNAGENRRFIIHAGDEMNFVCNARDAYDAVKTYFASLPQGCSACAGIAIFHSHAPYTEAYRIAEACCESAKKKMREEQLAEANLLDVHYCRGGIGTDLKTIRRREVGDCISKPWFIRLPQQQMKPEYITLQKVEAMAAQLNKISRSNVKGLAEHAKNGLVNLNMELARIQAHSENNIDFTLGNTITEEEKRKLIYDIVLLYDLWFSKAREGEKTDE